MKNIVGLFLLLAFQFILAQGEAVDYLKIGKTYKFDKKTYKLVWSSNPSKNSYKMEYILPNEKVEHYYRMIMMDFAELSPKQAVETMIANLNQAKKSNPIINYQVFENKGEYLLDFIISKNSADGKVVEILERNVYRYFSINTPQKKGVLLFGVSDRAYSKKEIEEMFANLQKNKSDLVNKVAQVPKPKIK